LPFDNLSRDPDNATWQRSLRDNDA